MIGPLEESKTNALDWLTQLNPMNPNEDSTTSGTHSDDPRSDGGENTGEERARGEGSDGDGSRSDWIAAESPTSRTLHGVAHGQDGPYACGEGGIFLHRTSDGWRTLFERGPGVSDNTLRSIAATDDGCRLWFAGDSGALGFYDVADGHLSDHSAPMEKTSTWEAIAVTGKTGEERVRIANGSGEVLDCTVEDGCPVWGDVVKPGGGSTIPGVTAGPYGFYAVDTSGGAYLERPDGGSTESASADADSTTDESTDDDAADTEPSGDDAASAWERIGVRNAQVDFQDIWAGEESVFIAGADGIAYRYTPNCENWTPLYVGQGALQTIRSVGADAVAVATGGRIYERNESVRWAELETPTDKSLLDLALARSSADVDGGLGTVPVDVAVGAGGTILERDRRDRSSTGDRGTD